MRFACQPWHWQQLCIHAESAYPEECCGLLLGQPNGSDLPSLLAIWPTHNAWDSEQRSLLGTIAGQDRDETRSRNFAIAPQDLLRAQKVARTQGWDIIGIYHSHPDHPAQPSAFDRAIAWEQYLYLILSVEQGKVVAGRVWQLDDSGEFVEVKLVVELGHVIH